MMDSQVQMINNDNDQGELEIDSSNEQDQKDYVVQKSDDKDYYVIIPNGDTRRRSRIIPMPQDLFLD